MVRVFIASRTAASSAFSVTEAEPSPPSTAGCGRHFIAARGELKNFTGISAPYEQPLNADLLLDTSALSVEQCLERILPLLKKEV